ncbi:hypothetical protein EON67_07885, partial [archaeon]
MCRGVQPAQSHGLHPIACIHSRGHPGVSLNRRCVCAHLCMHTRMCVRIACACAYACARALRECILCSLRVERAGHHPCRPSHAIPCAVLCRARKSLLYVRTLIGVCNAAPLAHSQGGSLVRAHALGKTQRYYSRADPHIQYTQALCTGIDVDTKTVSVDADIPLAHDNEATTHVHRTVPYDVLAVAIGARNNTFGIPGVEENMSFLKELADARHIRKSIARNVEAACLPGMTEEEQRRLLSFVIVGGGPTGVEFSAELHDFV